MELQSAIENALKGLGLWIQDSKPVRVAPPPAPRKGLFARLLSGSSSQLPTSKDSDIKRVPTSVKVNSINLIERIVNEFGLFNTRCSEILIIKIDIMK